MSKKISIKLNSMENSMFIYAAGYFDSGMKLIDIMLDEDRYSQLTDYMESFRLENIKLDEECNIFPIMFLFRQYLELEIKGFYLYFNIDNKKYYNYKKDLFNNHKLSELWPGLKKKLYEELLDEEDEDDTIICLLNEIIDKYITYDDLSFCFRFPFDRNKKFYLDDNNQYDLNEIKRDMQEFDDLIHEFM